MNMKAPILLLAALPLALAGSAKELSEREASAMIEEFDVIVDVRGEQAYRQSHVKGAVLRSKASLEWCNKKKVAFYCSSGGASASAANSYARQSDSDESYAIGTLENLAAAGVPTESGMPDQSARCAPPPEDMDSSARIAIFTGASLLTLLVVRASARPMPRSAPDLCKRVAPRRSSWPCSLRAAARGAERARAESRRWTWK